MKKRILIISGPSGTGKSILITELADTLFFNLRFCAAFGFDPGEILVDKIYKNGKKYPVKK